MNELRDESWSSRHNSDSGRLLWSDLLTSYADEDSVKRRRLTVATHWRRDTITRHVIV